MTRTVRLGSLQKGAEFFYNDKPFTVSANLGVAGVSVRPIVARKVKIGDREFVSRSSRNQVWSAGSEVEILTKVKGAEMAKETKKSEAAQAPPVENQATTKPKRTRTVRPAWSPEQWRDFIQKWQAATSFEAVCAATSLSADECRSRASTARKNGVNLKEHGKIDWEELKKLAEGPA